MSNKIFRFLTSIRLAIVLMVAIALICALDTLIPQNQTQQIYIQQFGGIGAKVITFLSLDHILSSVWMYVCSIAFGLNLALCTYMRIAWALGLSRQKFKLYAWGSPVLHVGLCIILIGVVFSIVFAAKPLYYEIPVGEVTSVQGRSGAFQLTVEDFGIEYYEDEMTPRQYTSNIVIQKENESPLPMAVEVNRPAHYDGLTILQQDYGWEVTVTLSTDQVSRELTIKNEEWIPLGVGDQAITLGVAFYPDYGEENGVPQYNGNRDRNPRIVWVLQQGDVTFMMDDLGVGENSVIQDVLKISFDDYRYYTGLQIKYDPGTPIIFGGFFLVCLGLVMRFLFVKKAEPETGGK